MKFKLTMTSIKLIPEDEFDGSLIEHWEKNKTMPFESTTIIVGASTLLKKYHYGIKINLKCPKKTQ